MTNLALLFFCLFLGVVLRRTGYFPPQAYLSLNAFVITIALPAMTLHFVPKMAFSAALLFPVLVGWLNCALALVFFALVGKGLGWQKSVIGALSLCAGFGNTAFIGIPFIQAIYGEAGAKTAILLDQGGTFIALSTVGIMIASFYSGTQNNVASLAKKIVTFPPFIAFILAILLNVFAIELPVMMDNILAKLGETIVPLALVSVGLQLHISELNKYASPLALGLLFKLLLFPLVLFLLYFVLFKQRGELVEIALLGGAMAPMITAAIVAQSYQLAPKLCNLMIGVGIPLSFVTLALWYTVIQFFH